MWLCVWFLCFVFVVIDDGFGFVRLCRLGFLAAAVPGEEKDDGNDGNNTADYFDSRFDGLSVVTQGRQKEAKRGLPLAMILTARGESDLHLTSALTFKGA